MAVYKHTCFAQCLGPRADEGPWGLLHGEALLVLLHGEKLPEVQSFPSIRASHLWPPKRLGSSRNSTVPSVGFLTLRWIRTLKSPGKSEKTEGKKVTCTPAFPKLLPVLLTNPASRDDGSGSGNTLLFHLMAGVACERGCGAALLGALLLQP